MTAKKTAVPTTVVHVRVDLEVKNDLQHLADLKDRTVSDLIRYAIGAYLDSQ